MHTPCHTQFKKRKRKKKKKVIFCFLTHLEKKHQRSLHVTHWPIPVRDTQIQPLLWPGAVTPARLRAKYQRSPLGPGTPTSKRGRRNSYKPRSTRTNCFWPITDPKHRHHLLQGTAVYVPYWQAVPVKAWEPSGTWIEISRTCHPATKQCFVSHVCCTVPYVPHHLSLRNARRLRSAAPNPFPEADEAVFSRLQFGSTFL